MGKIIVGIPARMGSSRFPGKPLEKICGMSMVEHVYKRCQLATIVDDIFVATGDDEIKDAVSAFGGSVIMTDPNISRPALRVGEAAKTMNLDDDDIVVVVQGDEPLVHPDMIELSLKPLLDENEIFVSNLVSTIDSEEKWRDPNNMKVVTDLDMNAIFMSRSPIPSVYHEETRGVRYMQVAIMPFRWHFFKTFTDMPHTPLDKAESNEMLRIIEHGYKIRMVLSDHKTIGVDTREELLAVEAIMKKDQVYLKYKRK